MADQTPDPATILAQKRAALANLEAIIASGIQTTQHGDRRVQYQELAQMRAEAQRLRDAEIADAALWARTRTGDGQVVVISDCGFDVGPYARIDASLAISTRISSSSRSSAPM